MGGGDADVVMCAECDGSQILTAVICAERKCVRISGVSRLESDVVEFAVIKKTDRSRFAEHLIKPIIDHYPPRPRYRSIHPRIAVTRRPAFVFFKSRISCGHY